LSGWAAGRQRAGTGAQFDIDPCDRPGPRKDERAGRRVEAPAAAIPPALIGRPNAQTRDAGAAMIDDRHAAEGEG